MKLLRKYLSPFIVVFLWVGLWDILNTERLWLNCIYVIVGYFGRPHKLEIWGILFWCGSWQIVSDLQWDPYLITIGSLSILIVFQILNVINFKK